MPAASCRIIPARNIRRCETISASFGVSRRMGRKNRDKRMDFVEGSSMARSENADRLQKHKSRAAFSGIYRAIGHLYRARLFFRRAERQHARGYPTLYEHGGGFFAHRAHRALGC